MISLIKEILDSKKVEYVINEEVESTYELFFVRHELQMNRIKDVKKYFVSIYHGHGEYMGNASTQIFPTMTKEEATKELESAIYGASLINNKPFKLAKPETLNNHDTKSNLDGVDKIEVATKIAESIFEADDQEKGIINATEIFINEKKIRVVNSNGVDYSSNKTFGQVEFISTWKGEKEEVEIYKFLEFANVDYDKIKQDVKDRLMEAKDRSVASPMPSFDKIDVLFRPLEIIELMSYYTGQCNVGNIYSQASQCKVGDNYQNNLKGDALTINIDPLLVSSLSSSPFDSLGFKNEEVKVIDSGKVLELWGNRQYAQYLGVNTRVSSSNIKVNSGTLDIKDLDRYIELVSMSGIQVDDQTGSFGGEIRLALLHENGKVTPLTGGSISGFVKDFINDVRLSNEVVYENNYQGPKYLLFKGCTILGK